MKKAISLTLGTGIFLFATTALAQYGGQQGGQWGGTYQPTAPPARSSSWNNIGDEGQLVISVDRIMGLSFDRVKTEVQATPPATGTSEVTGKATTFALFGMGGVGADGQSGAPSLMVPRLALDFFPIEGLSLGGSLIYITQSTEAESDAGSADGPTTSVFAIHPRVGYAIAFDETFSIWPRGGITYISTKRETTGATAAGDSETSFSGVELTVEALLGISPFENFAIGIGPYLDFPLSGTTESCTGGACGEVDSKLTSYGIMTSIMAYWSP
jgi:hypothetical protein